MATAPGVSVNVTAAASNSQASAPTGTWFVVGNASGLGNTAFQINSMTDFTNYFGRFVNSQLTGRYSFTSGSVTLDSTVLYDALDVYFREGGVTAYVSLLAPVSGGTAATGSLGTNVYTARSVGTWANSSNAGATGVIISISCVTVNSNPVYSATISYMGNILAVSPGLYNETDIKNWINSLPATQSLVSVATSGSTTALPAPGATTYVYLTTGVDAATADAGITAALAPFTDLYGPGQVSYPGATTAAAYTALTNHAAANNRVAVLDGANTATAATLVTSVQTLQAAVVDASYASMFAPWVIVPGVANTNPSGNTSAVFSRTVAPSSVAAALMAQNDLRNDANTPAAGVGNGSLAYVTGLSQTYVASDRASLNAAGVNVIRQVPNTGSIAIYGYRSCAFDPNWIYLNNVRFRMQIVRDFDFIGESFVFQQIDGKGQIFAKLRGALAGRCQFYWTRGSLYGQNPQDAFSVNCGPAVNTPATIAAGQINAQVNLRMSPFGEFVTINVTKYLASANLPS